MTKKKRLKTAAASVPVPQSRDEASRFIGEIGERDRELQRIQTEMNEELAAIKENWERLAQPHVDRIRALTDGVQMWCDTNRDALTDGGKSKTARLPAGEVAWRTRPPSVRVTGQESVLEALRKARLSRFIRTKEEVNKDAILNEPSAVASIPGISISRGEDFTITPFETVLAEGV